VAQRADQGPQVAHEGIGDQRSGRPQRAVARTDELGTLDVGSAHQASNSKAGDRLVFRQRVQSRDAVDVDEERGRGEAKLHEGDQALAPGEHLRLLAVLRQQREGFFYGRGDRYSKVAGNMHASLGILRPRSQPGRVSSLLRASQAPRRSPRERYWA
jgi:hypothetical protein